MIFQKPNSCTLNCSQDVRLRKSDRRKILTNLFEEYPELSEKLSYKTFLQDVMTSNDILKRKFSKKKCVTIYLRSPDDMNKSNSSSWNFNRTVQPIFVEIIREQKTLLVPCLSILSVCPQILPNIYIYPETSKFICRGANLMSVGIVSMEDVIETNLKVDKVVSICVIGNPTPFAAGIWRGKNDSSGVAVDVILGYGDDLWRMQLPTYGVVNEDVDEVDDGNYGNLGFVNGTHVVATKASDEEIDKSSSEEEIVTNSSEDDEEIDYDYLLTKLFYKSLLSIHDSTLPLPISTYYANNFKPILQDNKMNGLEKTSFRKLSSFLEHLKNDDNGGFLLSKDKNLLISIDKSHLKYRDAKREFGIKPSSSAKQKNVLLKLFVIPNHIVQKLNLNKEMYDIEALEAKNEKRRGTGFLTASECKEFFLKYCTQHNLNQQACIEMNETLGNLFSKESFSLLKKKDAIELFLQRLDEAYAILTMPQNYIYIMKRGKPPKIRLEVERRGGGNKKFITKVQGLEGYLIDANLFADDISKRFACSCTAIETPTTVKKKKPVFEVLVQGYIADDIKYLLTCGQEGKSSHGSVRKKGLLEYDNFFIPKGVIDIVLKKGVAKKK